MFPLTSGSRPATTFTSGSRPPTSGHSPQVFPLASGSEASPTFSSGSRPPTSGPHPEVFPLASCSASTSGAAAHLQAPPSSAGRTHFRSSRLTSGSVPRYFRFPPKYASPPRPQLPGERLPLPSPSICQATSGREHFRWRFRVTPLSSSGPETRLRPTSGLASPFPVATRFRSPAPLPAPPVPLPEVTALMTAAALSPRSLRALTVTS